MKKSLAVLFTVAATYAAPVMDPDSITVPVDDPRIGQHIYVSPDSIWMAWGNDNPPPTFGDRDYNDGVARISFRADNSGSAVWVGSNSAAHNWWVIEGQRVSLGNVATWGPLEVGTVLQVAFHVQGGPVYATGHHNVLIDRTSPTPEPSSLLMVIAGVALMAVRIRIKTTFRADCDPAK